MRVLIVEDDAGTAELEKRALDRAGIAAEIATTLAQARTILRQKGCDAVLLDYHLPDGDPWDIVELANALSPRVPVVLVTGQGNERIVAEAIQRGVADYVRKAESFWDSLADTVRRVSKAVALEERLRRSDALLQFIWDHASDVIVTFDDRGVVQYISPSCEGLIGRRPEAIVGMHVLDLVHSADRPNISLDHMWRAGVVPGRSVFRIASACGEPVWVEAEIQRSTAEGGDARSFLAVARDITERRRSDELLKQSEQRFRGAFETAAHGMALVSTEGRWLKVNQAICEMVGYCEEELLATDFQAITHPDDLEADLSLVRQLLADEIGSYQLEKRYFHKSGRVIWILLSVSLVRDERGKPVHFVSQIIDVTQTKEAQTALKAAKEEADRASQAKSQFLANMSHELRTPLNSVIGYTRLLAQSENLDASTRRHAQLAERSSMAMLAIVDDVLDAVALDKGVVVLRTGPVSLRDIFDYVAALLAPAVAAKDLSFATASDPRLARRHIGDEERLRQIVTNLASNAVKFTNAGVIELQWIVEEDDGGSQLVRLDVCDTGIGIPESLRGEIFEQFRRAEDRTEGSGLGLSIVRDLVELMGGAVSIESKVGAGSTFSVRLRLSVDLSPSDPTPAIAAPSPSRRILVVDDVDLNRELIATLLERQGHSVATAEGGLQALTRCREERFDLVLMDVRMPDMDGLEATRAILSDSRCSQSPIIALTAGVQSQQIAACLSAGMRGYLGKPVLEHELLRTVAEWGGAAEQIGYDGSGALRERFKQRLAEDRAVFASSSDRQIIGRLAHRMAGSAGLFGFQAIGDRARELDDLLTNPDGDVSDAVGKLIAAIDVEG